VAYSKTKAPLRANLSNPKNALQSDIKIAGKESNQEQFTGRGIKAVTLTSGGPGKHYRETDREIGTRVQFAENQKGSSTVKDPLNTYRVRIYPAVKNPDPVQNRSGVNTAPRRRSPNSGPSV
jgi:hypothetical protein